MGRTTRAAAHPSGVHIGRPVYLSKEWHALAAAAAKPNVRRALKPSTAASIQKRYRDETATVTQWLDQRAAAGKIRALAWHVVHLDDILKGYRSELGRGRLFFVAAEWIKSRGWRRAPKGLTALWLAPSTPDLPAMAAKRLYNSPANRTANVTEALAELTHGHAKPAAAPKTLPGTKLEWALLRFWTESARIWAQKAQAADGRLGPAIERQPPRDERRHRDPSPGPWAEGGWSVGRRL